MEDAGKLDGSVGVFTCIDTHRGGLCGLGIADVLILFSLNLCVDCGGQI